MNEPPPPPPAAATAIASPAAPASDAAIIVFANTPGASCVNCDTLKISVAPSGQVLIERGLWSGENRSWRYKRSTAHVDPARAAAFAATLRGDRPMGTRLRGDSTLCLGAGTENDGLVIEWIEAGRHDTLTYAFGCPAGRHSPSAERLRHAPDLLDLRELVWPGADGQP